MDSIKIRELEEKSTVNTTDTMIIEDNDGTKVVSIATLQSAIGKAFRYSTLEDVKNISFNEGDIVSTLGYHSVNDGGASTYIVVYAPAEVDNESTIIYLNTSDTLRLHLVTDGSISPIQGGAYGDGVNDDYSALSKLLKLGIPVSFPPKKFKISSPLIITNDTQVSFNGAELINLTGSCISIGQNERVVNKTIENAKCTGLRGIDTYVLADTINIINCKFDGNSEVQMTNAITSYGSNRVTISNCVCGSDGKLATAITLTSGNSGMLNRGSSNIVIESCDIHSKNSAISITGARNTDGVNISNCTFYGSGSTSDPAIYVQSSDKYISVSKCIFISVGKAISIASVIAAEVAATDILVKDAKRMYSVDSNDSVLILNGLQTYCGSSNSNTYDYYFEHMSGTLIVNSNICGHKELPTHLLLTAEKFSGKLQDRRVNDQITVSNATGKSVNLTEFDVQLDYPIFNMDLVLNHSDELLNIITFANGSADAINGQVLSLYSERSSVLAVNRSNGNIKKIGSNDQTVTLAQYKPVKIRYNGSYWSVIDC